MAGQDIIEWYDITFNSVHKWFAQTDWFIILIKKKNNTKKSQEFKVKSADPWLVKTDIKMFLSFIAGQLSRRWSTNRCLGTVHFVALPQEGDNVPLTYKGMCKPNRWRFFVGLIKAAGGD